MTAALCPGQLSQVGSLQVFLFVSLVFGSTDQKIITAESGKNITLPCRAPNNILVVKWSRADLGTEHVLLYRDEQFDTEEQHPSFKNRVDLQDRQTKDGDASLILTNVMTADKGIYEFSVFVGETRSWKSIIIYLMILQVSHILVGFVWCCYFFDLQKTTESEFIPASC